MNQRKSVFWPCLACLCILVLLAAVSQLDPKKGEVNYAGDYDGLQIYVDYAPQAEAINIWKGEECYYFFLPSNIDGRKLSFGNLGRSDTVTIEGQAYGWKDDVSPQIVFDRPCEMALEIDGETLPAQQVVFMRSAHIPAVFLETASGTLESIHADKTVKEEASMVILDEDGECGYKGGVEYVKARGNSTFYGTDKKSYQIKLYQKKDLLGMGKEKKWILLANAKDDSLIRNKLVYDFAAEYTDVPSIDGRYVDLYLNGDYAGNYFLCEKVEISENRLDITDMEKQNEAFEYLFALHRSVKVANFK